MAVPKKKVSPGRKKMRRQFYALSPVGHMTCPNCLELKRPHRVCTCGYYNDHQVIQKKAKAKKSSPQAETNA